VAGTHDGYCRLDDPVTHSRTLRLDAQTEHLEICDELTAQEEHDIAVAFHFAPGCKVECTEPGLYVIRPPEGARRVALQLDATLTGELVEGHDDGEDKAGWFSDGYHRKTPTTTLIGRCRIQGSTQIICNLRIRHA
jgi:hypothetical protein